jgi:hypothetical protein
MDPAWDGFVNEKARMNDNLRAASESVLARYGPDHAVTAGDRGDNARMAPLTRKP